MAWARSITLMMMVALAACMTVPPQPPLGPSYYVMRHLHTPEGASDPDLTPEGQRHAQLMVGFFREDPPSVIYVSDTKRARQTAAPLAASLGLTPKIYDPRNTPALIQAVTAEPGTVLVVGHSNTVPDIVEQLGGARPGPLTHHDFGDVWHVTGIDRQVMRLNLGD